MKKGKPPASRRPWRRRSGRLAMIVSAVTLGGAFAGAPLAAAHASGLPALTCSARTLPVRIADPGPADQTLWGQLCYRGTEPGTIQVLVPGATYNHLYWNFPYGNGYYSYVAAATAVGFATFDVDQIGTGGSSHPPSSELDLAADAVALHDAVTALRSGAVDGHAFRRVIMVGHSIGSYAAWIEAGTYHDVDAVIATGALHALSPNIGAIEADLYPAADDPKFAGSGLDTGYLTSLPGTRGSLFYEPATTNPNVVAADEANKDTVTIPELVSATEIVGLPPQQQPTDQITVPALSVVGENDALFCTGVTVYNCASPASVQSYESQFFPAAAHLKVVVIPDTGHDLALSTTAPVTDAVMLGWSLSVVAP
jgi:pimeloyl-ACP methyl ester carboxylesterase